MTVQEFINRRNRYRKAVAVPTMLEIAIVCLPLLVLLVVPVPWGPELPRGLWANLLVGLLFLVYVAAWGTGMVLYALYVEKTATDLGLQCPHCHRFLISRGRARRAIASRTCAHCGGRVLDDGA